MIVEDPQRGRFYRIGPAEYALLCEFDGRTPLAIALRRAHRKNSALELTLPQAMTLAQWLEGMQLAYRSDADNTDELIGLARAEADAAKRTSSNPFFLRIPIVRPDRLLGSIVPWMGWLFSAPATLIALVAAAWVLVPIAAKWRDVLGDLDDLFTAHRQFGLLAVWVGMKIVHEIGHGLVCKRYGGHVREAGLTFILFAPTAYIDVTSAWRFASRWQRIHVSAAGMYVEIVIAALAAVVWSSTSSHLARQIAADVILAGTTSTLLFNLNPLMRFDGYYILGDLLGLQNLYESGRRYIQYWGKRYLLGMPVAPPRLIRRRAWFVRVFGFAAGLWYVVSTACAIAGLMMIFHGVGLLLAMVGVAWWYVVPTVRMVKWLFDGSAGERPSRRRAAFVVVGGVALVFSILTFVPASIRPTAPAIVEYAPPTILRARVPGFVDRLCVLEGEAVIKNQLLCVLRNDELRLESTALESQLTRAEVRTTALRQRLAKNPQEYVTYEAAVSEWESLVKRIAKTRSQLADLEIRAPHEGRVVRRGLDRLVGVYLHVGDDIMSLGSEDAKQLRVSLAQEVVETLRRNDQRAVTAYMPGVGRWDAELSHLDPRATIEPPHMSLCVTNGGELAVLRADDAWELPTPRFNGFIALNADQALRLRVGQRCRISVNANHEPLGSWLARQVVGRWERAIHARE